MALTVGVLYLVGLGVQGLGLILHIVGLATPEWSVIKVGGASDSFGLWERCRSGGGYSSCGDYTSNDKDAYPALPAAEAFAIIGMIVGAVALVIGLLYVIFPVIGKPASPTFPTASCGTAIVAFICVLICVIVYGAGFHAEENLDKSYDIGYSFGLSITGGILMAIGGVLVFLGKSQTVG